MGGVLSHTLIGLLSGGLIYWIWRKPEFFLATLVGNTIVDFFKFFFAAVKQGTVAMFSVEIDDTFMFWSAITGSWTNWMALGFFFITLFAFLYHHHIIKRKTMWEYDEIVWAFLFGVALHLLLDMFYFEQSPWL